MNKVSLSFEDEKYEEEYCEELKKTTWLIIDRNMKALMLLNFIAFIYQLVYLLYFGAVFSVAFEVLFLCMLIFVRRSTKIFEFMALFLEISLLSIVPCFLFL
jgi:hypothetical protein